MAGLESLVEHRPHGVMTYDTPIGNREVSAGNVLARKEPFEPRGFDVDAVSDVAHYLAQSHALPGSLVQSEAHPDTSLRRRAMMSWRAASDAVAAARQPASASITLICLVLADACELVTYSGIARL